MLLRYFAAWRTDFNMRYVENLSLSNIFVLHSSLKRSVIFCLMEERKATSLFTLPCVKTTWKPWDSRHSFMLPVQLFLLPLPPKSRLFWSMISSCFENRVMGILLSFNHYLRRNCAVNVQWVSPCFSIHHVIWWFITQTWKSFTRRLMGWFNARQSQCAPDFWGL